MNCLPVRYYRLFATVLLLGAPMTGCTNQEYDDAYYAKVHTVTLLPKETKDPKATPPKPPFYEFKVAQGYLGGGSLVRQTVFAEFRALYPGMQRFTPSMREAWYPKSGGENFDVLKIVIRFGVNDPSDITSSITHRYEQGLKNGNNIIVEPSLELIKKIPSIRYFREQQAGKQNYDRYVFRQADGRTVTVDCLYVHLCHSFTTWKGKLEVEYYFNRSRFIEMADIDLAVNRLLDSFQPTLIGQVK